jgi:hypothetical protein
VNRHEACDTCTNSSPLIQRHGPVMHILYPGAQAQWCKACAMPRTKAAQHQHNRTHASAVVEQGAAIGRNTRMAQTALQGKATSSASIPTSQRAVPTSKHDWWLVAEGVADTEQDATQPQRVQHSHTYEGCACTNTTHTIDNPA